MFRLTKLFNVFKTLSSPVVNASKFLLGIGIVYRILGFRFLRRWKPVYEQQAQFESTTAHSSQSDQIRNLLEEIRMHLSNALNSRGRQRASWRNRVIDSTHSILELSYQILAIWPEKYAEEELVAAAALCSFTAQAKGSKDCSSEQFYVDQHGFPSPRGHDFSSWALDRFVQQSASEIDADDDETGTVYEALCNVVSHATLLQKWYDHAYADYQGSGQSIPKPVILWLDHLIDQSQILKSKMLDDNTMDKKELSDGEDEPSYMDDDAFSKPPLSHAFGANIDSDHAKKETPKYSAGDQSVENPRQSSIHFVRPDEFNPFYNVYKSGSGSGASAREKQNGGAAFFG